MGEERKGICFMDGIVTMGDHKVGEFEIELDDRIILKFPKDVRVKAMLDYASDQGMPVQLQMTPSYDEQEAMI